MSDVLDRLSAIVEPTRARLLRTLSREELGVGEIAQVVQLPQSTVSRHLKVLHTDGWLENRRDGTASLFRMAESLPPGAAELWQVVRAATEERWGAEDDLRLRAVLDARVVDAAAFFGQVAGRWEEVRADLFGTDYVLPTLLALIPSPWTVLDLGTGTGSMAAELAPAVARVIAVDREQAMLDAASARLEGLENVEILRASLHDLPLPAASVDAALCLLVLHHQQAPETVLAEARRVIRPGGRLVILDMVEHDRAEYRASMGHHHLGFSEVRLRELLTGCGFCEVRWRALSAEPGAKGPPLFVVGAS